MPIVSGDLLIKMSIKTGSAGNTTSSTAATSLGKYISTTQITDATLNNLFDDVTGDENVASNVDYKCIFIHNSHATLTAQNGIAWLSAEVAGGASAAIAVDNVAASVIGSSSAQADLIATDDTAPSAVSAYNTSTTKSGGLSIGSIPAGSCRAIWVRRTAANNAAVTNDGVTVKVEFDTAA